MIWDVILTAALLLMLAAADVTTPVSTDTKQFETMNAVVPAIQEVVAAARTSSTTVGTPGLLANDGRTLVIMPGTVSTTFTVYNQRPIGATAMPIPRTTVYGQRISVNGAATPLTLFVGPSGRISTLASWVPGQSAAAATACSTIALVAGTSTVMVDCATGTVTGP